MKRRSFITLGLAGGSVTTAQAVAPQHDADSCPLCGTKPPVTNKDVFPISWGGDIAMFACPNCRIFFSVKKKWRPRKLLKEVIKK